MTKLTRWMIGMSGVTPVFGPATDGMDVNARDGKHHTLFVLVNLAPRQKTVPQPASIQDILMGGTVRSVSLPQYGVAVLSEKTHQP